MFVETRLIKQSFQFFFTAAARMFGPSALGQVFEQTFDGNLPMVSGFKCTKTTTVMSFKSVIRQCMSGKRRHNNLNKS